MDATTGPIRANGWTESERARSRGEAKASGDQRRTMASDLRVLGALTLGVGGMGYVAGVLVTYPGRELSLFLTMVGITLIAVGGPGGTPG